MSLADSRLATRVSGGPRGDERVGWDGPKAPPVFLAKL